MGDVPRLHARVVEGDLQRRDDRVEVRAGRDLGDDAAEHRVLGGARSEALAQQDPVRDDPEAGLVAGGLDPEDDRRAGGGHRSSDIGSE